MSHTSATYRGQLFRSELEARWACFLDAMELSWVYRPYLQELQPTFLIGDWNLLVYVVPARFQHIEELKLTLYREQMDAGAAILLLQGAPTDQAIHTLFCVVLGDSGGGTTEVPVRWGGSHHSGSAYLVTDKPMPRCTFHARGGAVELDYVGDLHGDDLSLRFCDLPFKFAKTANVTVPDWQRFQKQELARI